jgi:glycosyltransferase involved in cell wall biosynthesis
MPYVGIGAGGGKFEICRRFSNSVDSPPERILIDAAAAQGGGGFTYLVNVLPRLAALAPNTRFRVLVRGSGLASNLPQIENLEICELPSIGLLGRFRFLFLEAPKLACEWDADIYFSTGEYCPFRLSCPSIVSFRNSNVFTELEQGWPLSQRLRLAALKRLALASARSASRVLFVSEDSAQWIGDSIGLSVHKRAPVQHGIELDRWRKPRGDRTKSARSTASVDAGILSVSSIYRYKNYVHLIEAYRLLHERGIPLPDLTIVGDDQDSDYSARMREARDACGDLRERIHLVGAVPYREVVDYYRRARIFVFPSYLETFGHPLLEAMAARLPVVASDIAVFREIAGDAACYFDPHDTNAMADAIERVLGNPDFAAQLCKKAEGVVEKFTWERSAAHLLEILSAAAAGH